MKYYEILLHLRNRLEKKSDLVKITQLYSQCDKDHWDAVSFLHLCGPHSQGKIPTG